MNFPKFLAMTGVAAVLLVPATPSLSLAQTAAATSVANDDSTLEHRAETAIKAQPTLKDQNIDVKVANKVVTLTGYVQTSSRKATAERAAKVNGVTRVDNQLVVEPKKGKGLDDKVVDATKTVAKKTEEGAKVVGEKTKDAAVATGANINDATINTKIHAKMVDEVSLKGSDVNVDVNNHVVTLKGTVASAAGKARAEEIARTTDGVRSVTNLLVIAAKK